MAPEGFIKFFLCFCIKSDYYFLNCFLSWGWRFSCGREEFAIARKVHPWHKAALNSSGAKLFERFPKQKHCLDYYSVRCEQIPFAFLQLCQFIPFCTDERPGAHWKGKAVKSHVPESPTSTEQDSRSEDAKMTAKYLPRIIQLGDKASPICRSALRGGRSSELGAGQRRHAVRGKAQECKWHAVTGQ